MKPTQFTVSLTRGISYLATQTTRALGPIADPTHHGSTQNEIGLPHRNSVYHLPMFHSTSIRP